MIKCLLIFVVGPVEKGETSSEVGMKSKSTCPVCGPQGPVAGVGWGGFCRQLRACPAFPIHVGMAEPAPRLGLWGEDCGSREVDSVLTSVAHVACAPHEGGTPAPDFTGEETGSERASCSELTQRVYGSGKT